MIHLTSLDGHDFVLNCELIMSVEQAPDTRITLTDDRKFIVQESADEVVRRVLQYRQLIHGRMPSREGDP